MANWKRVSAGLQHHLGFIFVQAYSLPTLYHERGSHIMGAKPENKLT